MSISPDALIGTRYKLLDCLGAGGMGEVWKAQDTNFTRLVVVAVKLLREDATVADDARFRSNLERQFQREEAAKRLTCDVVIEALADTFNVGTHFDALRAVARDRLGSGLVSAQTALALLEEVITNTSFNENARHRRRLRELFSAEANSVAVLQHPNIVRVTDYGEHEGLPFLVMDYIAGRTLHQVIQRRDPMPVPRRLRLMEELCEGLGYAHSRDLIHRDIKPANLIIDNETNRLKVLDFGVARTLQVNTQRSLSMGAPVGTLCYMSPEQTRANRMLDNRSDIFSVGLVCYELLGYQRAFPSKGDIAELVNRIQHEPPPPLRDFVPDLDPEVERIVYKALEKVPARRYSDLADMQREIEVVRLRLEEAKKRLEASQKTFLVRPKTVMQQVTDLLDRAHAAFETGDDHAVIEFCDQVLTLMPEQTDAVGLKRRTQARVKSRLIDEIIGQARALIASGELTSAGVLVQQLDVETHLPAVRQLVDSLQTARRTQRVGTLIASARAALAAEAGESAIEHARAALAIDPDHADAIDIARRAQRLVVEQRQRRVRDALVQAEFEAARGALDDAIDRLAPFAEEPDVSPTLAALRKQRHERDARKQAAAEALARAHASIAAGDVDRAAEAVDRASALDPSNQDVIALATWLKPIQSALERVAEAVELLDTDRLQDGEALLSSAAGELAPFRDEYRSIARLLSDAERARDSAHRREEERKRRDVEAVEEGRRQAAIAEQNRLARLVADASSRATAAIRDGQLDDAERQLLDMTVLPGAGGVVERLRDELTQAREKAETAAARRQCDAARELADQGDLEGAQALLQQYAPAHPLIHDELDRIGRAIVKRDEARRREEEAARSKREAERQREEERRARAEADERHRQEKERARAQAERERQEAERIRAEAERIEQAALERRVHEAIAASERLFADGDGERAIDQLRAFTPSHARIDAKARDLQRELERRAVTRAREEEERRRQEAERARQELERRADQAIALSDRLFDGGQCDQAVEALRTFAPTHPRVAARLSAYRLELERRAEQRAREEDEERRLEAERARQALEMRVDEVIGAAGLLFADGEMERAIAVLQDFVPQHPRIDAKRHEYGQEIRRREAQQRAEEQRRQEEARRARIAAERAARRERRQLKIAAAAALLQATLQGKAVQAAAATILVVAIVAAMSRWLAPGTPVAPEDVTPGPGATTPTTAPPAIGTTLGGELSRPPIVQLPPATPVVENRPSTPTPPASNPPSGSGSPRTAATPPGRAPTPAPATGATGSTGTTTAGAAAPPRPVDTTSAPSTAKRPDTPAAPPSPGAPPPNTASVPPADTVEKPAAAPPARSPQSPTAADAAARREIYELLAAYQAAYSSRNTSAVRALEPSFEGFDDRTRMLTRSIELRLTDVDISLGGDLTTATVTATKTINYQWVRAGPPPTVQTRIRWTVVKTGSRWQIR